MKDAYTTKELASALDVQVRVLNRRAQREGWKSRPRAGRGGGSEWLVASLPEQVRMRLVQHESEQTVCMQPRQTLATASVSDKKKRKALAKSDLVSLYLEWLAKAPHGGKAAARVEFISAYKGGAWSQLLEILGPCVSWKSIERWKKALADSCTVVSLVDSRGAGNSERAVMTEQHSTVLLRIALQPNAPALSSCIRRAAAAMNAMSIDVPSEATMRRFLKHWRETNFGPWVFTREGKKAWNDKAAFFIERDYSKIKPGDILTADGHVLNFETINPETGKPKRMELVMWYDMASNCPLGWEIMPTENTQAIASAFRRALITLGKYPLIAYLDNGRAFRSKYFNGVDFRQTGISGLFQELGIHTIFAWPYHGQSKTVERFFGTMHELEEWIPSYVGNCIDNKPPRLNRGEVLHRAAFETAGGRALTIEETHFAVAQWIDKYINTPQRGHLNGRTPAEVFLAGRGPGIDEMKLRHLMMAKEIRTIRGGAISLCGKRFFAEELTSRAHAVQVRYDVGRLDRVYVYSADGQQLICEAPRVDAIHPAADLLGTARDQASFREQLGYKSSQEKRDSSIVRAVMDDAITDHRARMAELEIVKEPIIESQPTKKLSQAKVASIEEARKKAQAAKSAAPVYTPPAEVSSITTELKKYEYLFGIQYREGKPLRDADAEWMESYEMTDDYRELYASRYDRLRTLYISQSQAN